MILFRTDRDYIPNYAAIATPLTDMTKKGQPNKAQWNEARENAYVFALRLSDHTKPFTLRADASNVGVGAVLMQNFEGRLFAIRSASKKLSDWEQKYSTMEKECLAIVCRVKRFLQYLYGREFILQTDHQPLTYLNKAKFINDRIMHWAMFLQNYKIRIETSKGSDNIGADYMSCST